MLGFTDEAVAFAVLDLDSGWRDWRTKAKSRESENNREFVTSPLVMIITVFLRVVLATHIHHDVT